MQQPIVRLSLIGNEDKVLVRPDGFLGGAAFQDYLSACREAGARYNATLKAQTVELPKLARVIETLRGRGYDVRGSQELHDRYAAQTKEARAQVQSAAKRADGLALYPFQREGVTWLSGRGSALLADSPGLGKTVQALVAAPANAPVLVVSPASVKGVWISEARRWRPDLRALSLSGRKSFRWPKPGELLVINYDILPGKFETDEAGNKKFVLGVSNPLPGTVLISDEAHALKSATAQRTKKFRALSKLVRDGGGKTWLLTGTPLLNNPLELWSIYQAAGLTAEAFGPGDAWLNFVRAFRGWKGQWGGFEWPVLNEHDTASIVPLLRRVSLRRDREEVLPDLPRKTYRTLTVDVFADAKAVQKRLDALGIDSDIEKVERLLAEFEAKLAERGVSLEGDKAGKAVALSQIESIDFQLVSAIRSALATVKIPALIDLVEQYETDGEPLVVFSHHRAPVDLLAKRDGWISITGDVPPETRTRIVDGFQAGAYKGIALTIGAGREGLTLTHASHVVFVDQAWTPALNQQAEDRICRIGQTRGVVVTLLTADHVVDERVAELLLEKRDLISKSVDAAAVSTGKAAVTIIKQEPVVVEEAEDYPPDNEDAVIEGLHPEELFAKNDRTNLVVEEAPVKPAKAASGSGPKTVQQEWAARGLAILSASDPDYAREENSVGFNKLDGAIGHSLYDQLVARKTLTPKQWDLAIKILRKYHRQIGQCPDDRDDAENTAHIQYEEVGA